MIGHKAANRPSSGTGVNGKCYNCDLIGHSAKNCPFQEKGKGKGGQEGTPDAGETDSQAASGDTRRNGQEAREKTDRQEKRELQEALNARLEKTKLSKFSHAVNGSRGLA